MAGRDLFANRSPQYLQQIGSKKKPVESTTAVNSMAEPVPRENPLVGEIQGNLQSLQAPERVPAMPVRFQQYVKETLGTPDELGLIKDTYAGGKTLVNDATEYGAQALNKFLAVDQSVAEDDDKLRRP